MTGKESVVVYESGFGMRAARVAWMLEYAGVNHVSLLQGGFREWRKSRFPAEKGARLAKLSHFRMKPNPRILATAGEIRKNKSLSVLDVRSEGEFRGTEGRECDPRMGRIPNSRWLEWTNFIEDGRSFKEKTGVSSDLKRAGLTSNKTVVTYCHRGARAAAAFYALRSLGYRDVKNYIGSWHEWSSRNDLPVEK